MWLLLQGSQSSEAGATEEQFLILVPSARPVALNMGLLGLLSVLALFILLGGVRKPELVEGLLASKYWGPDPPSGDMEVAGREEVSGKNSTDEESFPYSTWGPVWEKGEIFTVHPSGPFLLIRCTL